MRHPQPSSAHHILSSATPTTTPPHVSRGVRISWWRVFADLRRYGMMISLEEGLIIRTSHCLRHLSSRWERRGIGGIRGLRPSGGQHETTLSKIEWARYAPDRPCSAMIGYSLVLGHRGSPISPGAALTILPISGKTIAILSW